MTETLRCTGVGIAIGIALMLAPLVFNVALVVLPPMILLAIIGLTITIWWPRLFVIPFLMAVTVFTLNVAPARDAKRTMVRRGSVLLGGLPTPSH